MTYSQLQTSLNPESQAGFSFIELLVVVTLTVMLVVSASSVILTSLLSSGRANTVQTLKENGDYTMAQMTTLLRNAVKLQANDSGQTCQTGMSQLRFQMPDRGVVTFGSASAGGVTRIASGSGIYLTSTEVDVDSLTFDCVQSDDGLITTVSISFTLQKGTSSDRATEYGTQSFVSTVNLRSF